MDPHFWQIRDPEIQNLANPTDPDLKHYFQERVKWEFYRKISDNNFKKLMIIEIPSLLVPPTLQ